MDSRVKKEIGYLVIGAIIWMFVFIGVYYISDQTFNNTFEFFFGVFLVVFWVLYWSIRLLVKKTREKTLKTLRTPHGLHHFFWLRRLPPWERKIEHPSFIFWFCVIGLSIFVCYLIWGGR